VDEIGELPVAIQTKLLRVLEERRVMRVGGRSAQEVDVRFVARPIATSNATPSRAPFLSRVFAARFCAEHGRSRLRVSPECLYAPSRGRVERALL
jgi:Mg-chelatase subunit ChlI